MDSPDLCVKYQTTSSALLDRCGYHGDVVVARQWQSAIINTLGFDMVFAERDDSSGLRVLSNLQQSHFQDNATFKPIQADIEALLNDDQRFADSLQGKKASWVITYLIMR